MTIDEIRSLYGRDAAELIDGAAGEAWGAFKARHHRLDAPPPCTFGDCLIEAVALYEAGAREHEAMAEALDAVDAAEPPVPAAEGGAWLAAWLAGRGMTRREGAALLGVSYDTLRGWCGGRPVRASLWAPVWRIATLYDMADAARDRGCNNS